MKINIEIDEKISEPSLVIRTNSINAQVEKVVEFVKKMEEQTMEFVVGYDSDGDRTNILKPEDIYMLSVEDKRVFIYSRGGKFFSKKRLYELENQLGDNFFRVSKKTLINVNAMDHMEASFGGMFVITLKNGSKEYISKKYLPELKKYLGI